MNVRSKKGSPRIQVNWNTTKQQSQTHREQELLDLLHGVCHAQVGVGHGRKHLDEYVQLHREVGVFGLAAFPQSLLLEQRQYHGKESESKRAHR